MTARKRIESAIETISRGKVCDIEEGVQYAIKVMNDEMNRIEDVLSMAESDLKEGHVDSVIEDLNKAYKDI